MKKKFFLLFLAMSPLFVFSQTKKLALDGQKFTAEIFEDGKKKPLDPDDLSFNTGKFKSVLFGDWGFVKAVKYEVTGIDSTTTQGVKIYSWIADMTNEQDEKLSWSGTVSGDDIEGTIELVNKKGQTKKTFTFAGKLKKKLGQK